MRQRADQCLESEFLLYLADGADGGIEPRDVPTLIGHALQERSAAAAEVEESAKPVPGERAASLVARPPEEIRPEWPAGPRLLHLARPAMRAVIDRVESADGAGSW